MMKCRLLCALLVLALCCCPFLCVAQDSEKVHVSDVTLTATVTPSLPSEELLQEVGESESLNQGADTQGGKAVLNGDRGGPTGPNPQTNDVSITAPIEGTEDTTGTQRGTSISAGQADKNSKASAETTTTTTTTEAPTTTTTAPEAPSTTTTEAPTTTTTRAPSHLREVDGSLSSSAWVCSPLLLAVSALAYTTVG
ncbi:mucin TcMUCII [Trypanosoma cruzi]|uniref:Mucin TcMUCII n=2 Tax=Trypanosoma cruzi TaxID=5693 RepID=V5B5L7_TRYCR|nr:mucin TcMUCII [Trypanosoma cruzi Dm28c]PBJ79320.1 mucin TcMUCII [Trypanosoma cruzi cruzi]PWU92208.1 putative mucin TcMUCII [Trypanosoma cruzi]RNF00068.1 mucin TcMUCII [Trypanosoma cruzi]